MITDGLVRLSRKLRSSPLADKYGTAAWHDQVERDASKLSPDLAIRFRELMQEVRDAIPNDFSFWIGFEFNGANLSIEYEDGNTASFGNGRFFSSKKSMMRALRSIDWEAARSAALAQGGIFEEMVSEADDRPPNIPSSAEAFERLSSDLSPALAALRARAPRFAVIGAQDGRIETQECDSDFNLIGNVGDMMACCYDILVVVREGREITFEEMEELKRTTAEGLGPISRAKAEGRFFP